MKHNTSRNILAAVSLAAALAAPALHAATIYNGPAGGNTTNSANWSDGLPTNTNPGTLGTNAVVSSNRVSTIEIVSGATLTSTNHNAVDYGGASASHVTITEGTFTGITFLGGAATVTINGLGVFSGATINSRQTTNILVTGGLLTADTLRLSAANTNTNGFLTLAAGDGSVVTTNTVNFGSNSGFINFLSGSGATLNFGSSADETYYSGLWDNSQLQIDGANTGTFAENFSFDTTTNELSLVSVPEPSGLAFLSLAGFLGFMVRRR